MTQQDSQSTDHRNRSRQVGSDVEMMDVSIGAKEKPVGIQKYRSSHFPESRLSASHVAPRELVEHIRRIFPIGERHLEAEGRTGFTPYKPNRGVAPKNIYDRGDFNYEQAVQRVQLHRFTVFELYELGAMYLRDAQKGNLDNPIHPIFRREHWLRDGTVPLPWGLEGMWDAGNDAVWNALQPCFRLSSQFLTHMAALPWFDAYLFGDRRPMAPRTPDHDTAELYTFHLRSPEVAFKDKLANKHAIILRMVAGRIIFNIDSGAAGEINPISGFQRDKHIGDFIGETYLPDVAASPESYPNGSVAITMSYQDLAPLLRPGIPVSTRLMVEFKIAAVLVHELMHALDYLDANANRSYEAYFESESMAEAGLSWENAIFGGIPWQFYVNPDSSPNALQDRTPVAVASRKWPNFEHFGLLDKEDRKLFPNPPEVMEGYTSVYWPVPVNFFELIQQKEFWEEHVNRYQAPALQPFSMAPRILGQGSVVGSNGLSFARAFKGADYQRWESATPDDPELLGSSFETQLRRRAYIRVQNLKSAYPWVLEGSNDIGDAEDIVTVKAPVKSCPGVTPGRKRNTKATGEGLNRRARKIWTSRSAK